MRRDNAVAAHKPSGAKTAAPTRALRADGEAACYIRDPGRASARQVGSKVGVGQSTPRCAGTDPSQSAGLDVAEPRGQRVEKNVIPGSAPPLRLGVRLADLVGVVVGWTGGSSVGHLGPTQPDADHHEAPAHITRP